MFLKESVQTSNLTTSFADRIGNLSVIRPKMKPLKDVPSPRSSGTLKLGTIIDNILLKNKDANSNGGATQSRDLTGEYYRVNSVYFIIHIFYSIISEIFERFKMINMFSVMISN